MVAVPAPRAATSTRPRQCPNLTVVTHALTDRILFSGQRAVGVDSLHDNQAKTAHARREVLLCSGAIASPQVLQRSGVSPGALLQSLDIPVVLDLPGAGANLQDHLDIYQQYECLQPVSMVSTLKWWNQPAIGAEWLFLHLGIGATHHFEAGREITPSDPAQNDAELDAFVRQHAETAYHPCGTNAMGQDEMSVVDGQGRVHGLEGLRVIDASIMPVITTGNLNAATTMMAEKIADRIRGRAPLPRSNAPCFIAGTRPARQA